MIFVSVHVTFKSGKQSAATKLLFFILTPPIKKTRHRNAPVGFSTKIIPKHA